MISPLNPTLFRQLQNRFGTVKVTDAGIARVSHFTPDKRELVTVKGEQYRVNCPTCGDTRFRLYISYTFGIKNPQFGFRNLHCLFCLNESCMSDFCERQLFFDYIAHGTGRMLENAVIRKGVVITPGKIEPPGPMMPLHTLAPTHVANQYLASRFVDPELVGRVYGVSYCPESKFYLARDRIIIPFFEAGKLVGWQARYIGDIDFKADDTPPKYWSCPGMPRGNVVYNIDKARLYATGVVMEGPSDVWSFGSMGMATLGFPPTLNQLAKIVREFRHHSLVLLFDSDIQEKERTAKKLEEVKALFKTDAYKCDGGVACVALPSPFDPGDLDRVYLRPYVAYEAAKQGVKVAWRKIV